MGKKMGKELPQSLERDAFDHVNPERHRFKADPGVNEKIVREISRQKKEPEWMLSLRLKAFKLFLQTPNPTWGPTLEKLNYILDHEDEVKEFGDNAYNIFLEKYGRKKAFDRVNDFWYKIVNDLL